MLVEKMEISLECSFQKLIDVITEKRWCLITPAVRPARHYQSCAATRVLSLSIYSVAISTEILTHYSCFMEKNEKWGSGLNFINSIKDLPPQNIWKKISFSEVHISTSDKARLYDVYVVKKISRTNSRQDAGLNIGPFGAQNFHRVSLCPP